MAAYGSSSQLRHWTFTPDELERRRSAKFADSDARRVASADAAGTSQPSKKRRLPGSASSSDESAHADPLNQAEELELLRHYERDIIRLCKVAGFDRAILATTVAVFKRFYLNSSPTEYPPSEIINTAVFLGIKTEACPYTEFGPLFGRLARYRGVPEVDIVGAEIPLLTSLRYQLTMYHPYRPLKTLLVECIRAYVKAGSGGSSSGSDVTGPHLPPTDERFQRDWDVLQSRAFELVDVSLATDASLLYSPAHIACACLLLAIKPLQRADPRSASASSSSAEEAAQYATAASALGVRGVKSGEDDDADGALPAQWGSQELVSLTSVASGLASALASAPSSSSGGTGSAQSAAAAPPSDVAWFVEPWLRRRLEGTAKAPLPESPDAAASSSSVAASPSGGGVSNDAVSISSAGSSADGNSSDSNLLDHAWPRIEAAAQLVSDELIALQRAEASAAVANATASSSSATISFPAYHARAAWLEWRLAANLNAAFVEGTPQFAARLAAVEAARAAYKAGKPAGLAAVRQAHGAGASVGQ